MANVKKNTTDDGARDAPSAPDGDALRQDIARRAYGRYCERGRMDGFDVEDWLAAEQELLQDSASAATLPAKPGRSAGTSSRT